MNIDEAKISLDALKKLLNKLQSELELQIEYLDNANSFAVRKSIYYTIARLTDCQNNYRCIINQLPDSFFKL
jgi:hypothetical protein